MSRPKLLLIVVLAPFVFVGPASPQILPRNRNQQAAMQEPVAETKLLMEGLLQANFRGLDKNLRQPPTDQETWAFVRGQSLIIAETGNLLMLRPPKSGGQDFWYDSAAAMREKATAVARFAANRDADRCRRSLVELANTCNRCHKTFQVPVQVTPFAATP